MKTLVFDTCFNKSYIVLSDNEKIINAEIIQSTDANYHSAFLIPKIRDFLKTNNLQIKDLDAIGVNIGPGSFTGIRAGITIARVMAQQANLKLIGITSLEILSKLAENKGNTIVTLDARRNKVYFAQYKNSEEIISACLIDKEELINRINNNTAIIADSSISSYLKENNIDSINYEISDYNLGLYLSEIVNNKLTLENDDFNWAKVKPLYIQKPSITKPKEIKNV